MMINKVKCVGIIFAIMLTYMFVPLIITRKFNISDVTAVMLIAIILACICLILTFKSESAYIEKLPSLIQTSCGIAIMLPFSYVMLSLYMLFINTGVSLGIESRNESAGTANVILLLVYTIFVGPVCEEIIFRLYVQSKIKKSFGRIAGIVVSSILFAVMHGTIYHMISATMLGIMLCIANELTGSIWLPAVMHVMYNMHTLVINEALLTKSMAAIVLLIIIIAILEMYFLFRRKGDTA